MFSLQIGLNFVHFKPARQFLRTTSFGGPIETPNFQRIADAGPRYTAFHTTALCSPTRSALITGRNHHTNASGVITEMATGFCSYVAPLTQSDSAFCSPLVGALRDL